MNNYRLEELSEFIRNGASIKQFENAKGYPITRIETISDSYVNLERVGYADIMEFGKYEEYLLDIGDILMSHINSDKHLGKTAIFENENVKLIHGMNLLCIRPNKKIVSPKYLNYYFKSLDFKKQLPKITKKSVNQASFSVSDLKKLKCKIHSIENQKKIVEILDKSQELIDKRKKQIEELDLLVKSKFIEMFNIWFSNKESYRKLVEICNFIDYRGKTPEKSEIGIPLITAKNVKNNRFSFEPREYIPMKNYKDVMTRGIPSVNDILFTTEAPLGNVCRIPNIEGEFCVGQRLITMKPLEEICSEYLEYALLSKQFQGEMWKHASGSTVKGIRSKELVKLSIPVPPIELQNQFANFVKQVDKLKFEMEKSLKELEDNFNSLMQKAFKSELFK
ncbi:restriction endonuclease subunit S [Clostridium perfringens]|uniref:restriction endonuclease subunit S n=1 Tax=Clostridium perfringens TaxID=1502 RepID=UPI0039EA5C71